MASVRVVVFFSPNSEQKCPAMAARRALGRTDDERTTLGVAAQVAPPTIDVLTANGQAPAVSDQESELPTSVELWRTQVVRPAEQGRTDGAKRTVGQVTALKPVSHSRGVLSLHLGGSWYVQHAIRTHKIVISLARASLTLQALTPRE